MQQYKTAPSDGGINDWIATKYKYKTWKIQNSNMQQNKIAAPDGGMDG